MAVKKVLSVVAAAGVIASIIILRKGRRRRARKSRIWTKTWIHKRNQRGAFHSLMEELRSSDPSKLCNFLRMDEASFEELLNKVSPIISKQDTTMRSSISAAERLAITLRYLSSGDSFTSLQYLYWVPKQMISKIVPEVCEAIYQILEEEYMKMPKTDEEWSLKAQGFRDKWNFPNCVGDMDEKHVVIQVPSNSGSYYFNYKGTFSIVLLAVVDADYRFTYVDIGCNGRISDGGVFKHSTLGNALQNQELQILSQCQLPGTNKNVPYVFVADDAFPLKTYIMKPYSQRGLTEEKRLFNYRLSRARRIVENVFGILSNRFRVFTRPIALEPSKVESVVLACTALHNFLRCKTIARAICSPTSSVDQENSETGTVTPGTWRNAAEPNGLLPLATCLKARSTDAAKDLRDEMCKYFCSEEGAVPWQWRMIQK